MSLLTQITAAVTIPLMAGGAVAATNVNNVGQTNTKVRHESASTEVHRSLESNFQIQSARSSESASNPALNNSVQGMEVEIEHGVATLKPHNSSNSNVNSDDLATQSFASDSSLNDDSSVLNDSSSSNSGFEDEIEHGVTTLVPHSSNDSNSSILDQSNSVDSGSGSSGRNNSEVVHEQNRRGRGSN